FHRARKPTVRERRRTPQPRGEETEQPRTQPDRHGHDDEFPAHCANLLAERPLRTAPTIAPTAIPARIPVVTSAMPATTVHTTPATITTGRLFRSRIEKRRATKSAGSMKPSAASIDGYRLSAPPPATAPAIVPATHDA